MCAPAGRERELGAESGEPGAGRRWMPSRRRLRRCTSRPPAPPLSLLSPARAAPRPYVREPGGGAAAQGPRGAPHPSAGPPDQGRAEAPVPQRRPRDLWASVGKRAEGSRSHLAVFQRWTLNTGKLNALNDSVLSTRFRSAPRPFGAALSPLGRKFKVGASSDSVGVL